MARLDASIEPTEVMAERRYVVEGSESRKAVTVRIGFPREKGPGHFECRAEIGDDETRVVRPMGGKDAFEALMLALQMIGIELALFCDVARDQFAWLGGQEHGLRFPTEPDYSLEAIHDSRVS